MSKKVDELDKKNDEIIVTGDLNCDMLDKENSGRRFDEFSKKHGFKHTNKTEGTRTNPTTQEKTLLDISMCYNMKNFIGKKIFHTPFSDHAMIVNMFDFKKLNVKKLNLNREC